jgi:valyl-tRNA synthetase
MQTLQAGSFLNLENDQGVEALKFTARRLAEHSEGVVAENLNAAALENLANNLWEKAEYVARETERRRLKQISSKISASDTAS